MEKNISKTKKDLSIIFSLIVFIIVLFLGTVFFSTKYFREVSLEKRDFSVIANELQKGRLSIEQIMSFGTRLDKNMFNKKRKKTSDLSKSNQNLNLRGFINYVLINNESTIISSNIKDNIDIDFMLKINDDEEYFNIKQSGGYLIKKFLLNNNRGTFIIIKDIRYSFIDYISDLFGFFIINILFSLILYFIGLKFVNRAFIPVEENIKDMKDFIHNAGHELKTPISVIDSNIQLIDDSKTYDSSMTKELKNEVKRLNSIIEGLIKLSNIDSLKNLTKNNLKESIEEIIKEFKYKISEKKMKINLNLSENIIIKSNKDYLYIFLSNIIGNAIKYNNKKGNIDILYSRGELIIKDSGVGIEKENLDKIFDRFYKVDKSRNTDGFGIGLSLVKKIANIYKWKIRVDSEEKRGTSFKIKF